MINSITNLASIQTPTQKSDREVKVEEFKEVYQNTRQKQISQILTQVQSSISVKATQGDTSVNDVQEFKDFLSGIGYEGKPIGVQGEMKSY